MRCKKHLGSRIATRCRPSPLASSVNDAFNQCGSSGDEWCFSKKPADDDRVLLDNWRDYLVFTFVRNPYARAASAYTFLNDLVREHKVRRVRSKPYCKVDFSQFCANPRVLGKVARGRGGEYG